MTRKKVWMFAPPKPAKAKVPDKTKIEVKKKCDEFIETVLKPLHIKPPPEDRDWNYIVDMHSKWYQCYFYFIAIYNSPSPQAIKPSFEVKFARLQYMGNDGFNLSYMRHTEQWFELFEDLSLEECLENIKEMPHFLS